MNKTLKIALAGMLAASSLGGIASAQTAAAPAAPMAATEGVNVVRIDSLNTDSTRGQYRQLMQMATDTAGVQEAQAEVQADPAITAALAEQNLQLSFVVDVVTAANGGKIVYVR